MKKLLLLLISVFYLAKASAQDTTTVNFYGEKLNTYCDKKQKHFPLLMTHTTYKNKLQVRLYEPNSTQILCTIAATNLKYSQWNRRIFCLPDADFEYTASDKTRITYSVKTMTLSRFTENKVLEKTYAYRFLNKDSSTVITEYYTNGGIYKQKIYKNKYKSIDILQYNIDGINSLEAYFAMDMSIVLADTTRIFFYNKKLYSTIVADTKHATASAPYYTKMEIYDSTGVKNTKIVYKDKKEGFKSRNWLEFYSNGRLNTSVEVPIDTFGFTRANTYSASGALTDMEIKCENLYSKKGYVLMATDNMFAAKEAQKYSLFAFYSYRKHVISTPLFSILLDSTGKSSWQYLSYNKAQWSKNACPPTQPYIVKGDFKGILPVGKWQIYTSDTAGNAK